jgi:uncharacterized membrane protein HdeD (DUF308 family)
MSSTENALEPTGPGNDRPAYLLGPGLIFALLGIFTLTSRSSDTVALLPAIGMVLLIAGMVRIFRATRIDDTALRVATLGTAAIGIAGGAAMLLNPSHPFFVLMIVVFFFLLSSGGLAARYGTVKKETGWTGFLLAGSVIFVLSFVARIHWNLTDSLALLVMLGAALLIEGLLYVGLGTASWRYHRMVRGEGPLISHP